MSDSTIRDAAVVELKQATRVCSCCKEAKPLAAFPKNKRTKGGYWCYCRICATDKSKAYYWSHRDQRLARQKVGGKRYRDRLRADALAAYGGMCACCGETTAEFLAIDHINGGGGKHRKEVGSGQGFHLWLRKLEYPEGFRILCHNCNMAIAFYGECPHACVKVAA